MNMISIMAIGVAGAFAALTLKQYKPEFSMAVSLITACTVMIALLGQAVLAISEIKELMSRAAVPLNYLKVLLKALGICYITQFASDTCKDAGQTSIAGRIELLGRIAVCVCALPLYGELISLAEKIVGKVT